MKVSLTILWGLFCQVAVTEGQLPCNTNADLTIMLDNSADVTSANYDLIKDTFLLFTSSENLAVSAGGVSIL